MAIFTPKRLSGPAFLTTSVTAAYTVGAGKTGVLKQIVLNNTGSASNTVTVNVVPNGASPTTSNQVISLLNISGYSQIIWTADIPLDAGDSIQVSAAISNTVTATISGIEIS